MVSPHREVLAATFYKFLLKNIGTGPLHYINILCLLLAGGSEKFQDKQKFFYSEVKKMRSHLTRSEIHISVSRYNLLEEVSKINILLITATPSLTTPFDHTPFQAMQATKHLSGSDWYKKFSIDFKGEEGVTINNYQ